MQEKWKDLIPFYVAGTLSEDDKNALEAYLAQCGEPCENEIEEWRTIASATWQHVNETTSSLPPLSPAVLAEVAKDAPVRASGKIVTSNGFRQDSVASTANAPVYLRRDESSTKRRLRPRIPLTMVAAFMTVVIFGGILLTQLNPEDLEPQSQVIELTEVTDINETKNVDVTQDFGGEIAMLPENPDSGIVSTPTPLPTRLPPTVTPPLFPTTLATNNPASSSSMLEVAPQYPSGTCIVRNDTEGALTTYRNASFDAERTGIFGAGAEARVQVIFAGWYMVSYGNWVYGENVTVLGDCANVWTATPTAIGDDNGTYNGIPDCVVRNTGTEPVNLYQWADYNSPVNGRLGAGQESKVYIGDNGWYQVFYAQWVNANEVTIEGVGCNQLWIPTPTISASPTPVPTLSNVPSAIVIVQTAFVRQSAIETALVVDTLSQGTPISVLAYNDQTGGQMWFLVQTPTGRNGWVQSTALDVRPNNQEIPFATSQPTPTSSPQAPRPTMTFTPTATFTPTPVLESWSHLTTVVENGCGGTVGTQSLIMTRLQRLGTQVIVTYPDTGTTFTLTEVAPNTFSGSYTTSATVNVDVTFTSSTTYTGNESVVQASGCVVRSTWAGTKE